MSERLDARALFAALADAEIRYVVIGGWAVNAHGYLRTTQDIDLCPAPDGRNLECLAALLAALGSRQLGLDDFDPSEVPGDPTDPDSLSQGGSFRVETRFGILDVMQWLDSADGSSATRTWRPPAGVLAEPFGIPVTVCSLAHLLAMKRRADRDRDRDDLRHLLGEHVNVA